MGVELPRNYEGSVKAMEAAWPHAVRTHDAGVIEWVLDFTGTASGADADIAIGAAPGLIETDKQVLRDAHDGKAIFYAYEDPADDLYRLLTETPTPPDDELEDEYEDDADAPSDLAGEAEGDDYEQDPEFEDEDGAYPADADDEESEDDEDWGRR